MLCCLSSVCHNPPATDDTKFCPNCGVPLLMLRNRYRPIQPLGGGGFGKTYLAEDRDKLDEKCVIKQFAPQTQGTAGLQKATELFEEEAKRLQQLGEHPQIPTLLAYFQEDGRLYLVQQFIDGQNLLKRLQQRGTFNEEMIRELLVDLLNILQVVHQHKVIHRDLKPENIILRNDGKVVLIDFGASKQLTQTVITGQGTMIGSFGYAPLEQIQQGEAYPASDLFSLGVTCFHLLSGIHPWELWKSQGYGWIGSWKQHLPQPLTQQLELIIDNLLKEDYQQRYQSAGELLQYLNPPLLSLSEPLTIASDPATTLLPIPLLKNKKKPKKALALTGFCLSVIVLGTWNLYRSSQPYLFKTIEQENIVNSVAINPDGQSFVTGVGSKIKTWNLQTGELKSTLNGHNDSISCLALSLDGKILVSGSNDGTIKIWNLQTNKLKSTLSQEAVNSVSISPDGNTFLTGSWRYKIRIWNLQTGELKSTFPNTELVSAVAMSPDGKTFASGNHDGIIKVWDLQTGTVKSTFNEKSFESTSIAISPDSQHLVSAIGNYIKIWNLQTGKLEFTLTGHSEKVNFVAISQNGKTLVSASNDNNIKIWDLQTGTLKSTLSGHSDWVHSVAISPNGKTIVSGSSDKAIKIWRIP
ncbi:MAG: serine/threonine protein kinase [Fischerella sp. CENA71]|nr:serine/threonine protein kinase [Fischerella sp. CENA71]